MKIEMGESLIDSWLNHIKKCQLHQMNFKLSSNWDIPDLDEKLKTYQDIMTNIEKQEDFQGIFKNANLTSLLKQAEIDNIGVDFINSKLYAVDIAFHEGGLNYTKKDYSTAMNIAKKYFRTIFLTKIYFPHIEDQTIIFASPKVNPKVATQLEEIVNKIRNLNLGVTIELFMNNKFTNHIYKELVENTDNDNDTSELFLRSIKLHNLCSNVKLPKTTNKKIDSQLVNKPRVGIIAKELFLDMLKNADNNLLVNLQSADYARETFGMRYPILYKGTEGLDKKRYYINPIKDDYYLTNDWYEKNREKLENFKLKEVN